MHRRWAATALALAALVAGATTGAAPAAVAAHRPWTPVLRATVAAAALTNPATNVAPSPDYWPTCSVDGASSAACTDAVLTAINNARALEGVAPMVLPAGFASMTTAQQTFVVSNLERVDRGLAPAVGMVGSLDALASSAATNDADPLLPAGPVESFVPNGWGSIWAGDLSALAADYDWMYNDGWGPSGSYNLDCTTATASGCWGHRDNILMPDSGEELITGVGSVVQSQWTSIAQILVLGTGSYPAFDLTWADVTGTAPVTAPVSAPPPPVPDATSASVSMPSTIVTGQTARVVGHLTDALTRAPLAGAAVSLCRRAVTSASTVCTSMTTDATGAVVLGSRPTVQTSYWLVFAGTPTAVPVTTPKGTVHVRPAVTLRGSRTSTGWRIVAILNPARGQSVLLRRYTSSGWVTVRHVTAMTTMTFGRLRTGSYRLVVGAVTGSLSTHAGLRIG